MQRVRDVAAPTQVSAEALRVGEQLVRVLRPNPPAAVVGELQGLVQPLFDGVRERLAAQDQDQEVGPRSLC